MLDIAAASIGMGEDWVHDMPDWARLQYLLVLTTVKVGKGQAGLGLCTC